MRWLKRELVPTGWKIYLRVEIADRIMKHTFTAVIKQDEGWWIGWVEEIPGVNSQGKTRAELLKNLRSALREALEMNREEALAYAGKGYEEAMLKV